MPAGVILHFDKNFSIIAKKWLHFNIFPYLRKKFSALIYLISIVFFMDDYEIFGMSNIEEKVNIFRIFFCVGKFFLSDKFFSVAIYLPFFIFETHKNHAISISLEPRLDDLLKSAKFSLIPSDDTYIFFSWILCKKDIPIIVIL